MTDFLDSLAEGVGGLAKPLAPALDFLGLGAQGFAQGPTPQDLLGQIGSAAKEAVMASPLGLVTGGAQFLQGASQMSSRDRLLYGGLLLAGGVGAARMMHARWRGTLPSHMSMPTGVAESQAIGMGKHFLELGPEAIELAKSRPGIRGRQASILAPEDKVAVARAVARFDVVDELDPRLAGIGGWIDQYASTHPDGPYGARLDIARFDHAIDHGLLKYGHNDKIRKAYRKLTGGEELNSSESALLGQSMKALGDATSAIDADDLSIGIVSRVSGVDFVDGKAVLTVTTRTPDAGDLMSDEKYRAKALTLLNARSYATQGRENFLRLYKMGMADSRIREFGIGEPVLPSGLERGPDWYPVERENIAAAFGLGVKDGVAPHSPELDRAVATTSLLSEAELWANNIRKAKELTDQIDANPAVLDDDFQAWLQDGTLADYSDSKSRRVYAGTKAKKHEKAFNKWHKEVLDAGFKVKAGELKKVMRLARETPADLFRGSGASKQKNFYLNLLHPDLEYPVTIDMHQFDAFFGLDSGTQDRPVGDSVGAGEQNYDVIADVVRSLASELDLRPHQLQAVIWETWRSLKFAHPNGWHNGDPFMLKPQAGQPNPVFEALMGRGQSEVFASLYGPSGDTMPLPTLLEGSGQFDAVLTPEGGAVYATAVTPYTDLAGRQLYPSVVGGDGVPRWLQVRPQRVQDPSRISVAQGADDFAHIETFDDKKLQQAFGGYPGMGAQEVIVFDAAPGFKPKGFMLRSKVADLGGVQREASRLDYTPRFAEEIADEAAGHQMLERSAWVIIDDPKAASAARRDGYGPIKLEEGGWLVPGGTEDQALKWGSTRVWANGLGERPQVELAATASDVATILKANPDGFTFDLQTGQLRTTGIAMAERGGELRIPANGDVEGILDGYIEANRAWLSRPGMNIGGWYSSSDDTFVLDVTRVHPKGTPTDEILREADVQMQEAAFDIDTFTQIDNPKWGTYDEADRVRDPQNFTFRTANGETVTFDPNEFVSEVGGVERATTQAQRYAMVVDRSHVHMIDKLAEDLESKGGSNLVIHTTRTEVPGFSRAREHAYSDGIQTKVLLTRDDTAGVPNSVPVYVRSTFNLADAPRAVETSIVPRGNGAVVNNSVTLANATDLSPTSWNVDPFAWSMEASEGGPVTRSGKKWKIDLGDRTDVAEAVRQSEVLRAAGVAPADIEIQTVQGKFSLQKEEQPTITNSPRITAKWGGKPPLKGRSNLKDDDIFVGAVRISPNSKIPRNGKLVDFRLDQSLIDPIVEVTEKFMAMHDRAAEVWRLPGILVDGMDDGAFAQVLWEPGSAVSLTKSWWSDPGLLRAGVEARRAEGFLTSRAGDPAAAIVAHELGHVLHGAASVTKGFTKNTEIDKKLRALEKRYGGKKGVAAQLSGLASMEPSELVAEAMAEILTAAKPSRLALEVHDLVTSYFEEGFKYRALLWGAS